MSHDETSGEFVDEVAGAVLEWFSGLAGVAVPGAGAVTRRFATKVREEIQRNRSIALRAAEQASGLSREDLAERIAENPRLIPLATRLLHAAGMSGHDGTLRAMGETFGRAAWQPESVDECQLILTSLADLTDTHTDVLLRLSPPAPLVGGRSAWIQSAVEEGTQLSARVTALCLATLVAHCELSLAGAQVCPSQPGPLPPISWLRRIQRWPPSSPNQD